MFTGPENDVLSVWKILCDVLWVYSLLVEGKPCDE